MIDVVEILKNGHGGIGENSLMGLNFINDINVSGWSGGMNISMVEKKTHFMKDLILPHFRQEETVIYLLRKDFDLNDYASDVIKKVVKEHEYFRNRIQELQNMRGSLEIFDLEVFVQFRKEFNKLMEGLFKHAEYEDTHLFPLFRRMLKPEHIRYIEDKWKMG